MTDSAVSQDERERRNAKHRSNVMLAALVDVRGLSANVRIRNISESGALIEGSTIPETGTSLVLVRNQLSVSATVIWSRRNRCGLKFDQRVVVPDWVSQPRPGAGSAAQQRVDQLQAEIRTGHAPAPRSFVPLGAAAEERVANKLPLRLAEEIAYVQRLIESIGDELIAEPLIVHRHANSLQKFDAVNQILGHVSTILKSADQLRAVEAVGMEELRARLLRL